MPNLKMLNSTKYLYKLTLIKCSYAYRLRWRFIVTDKRNDTKILG